MICLTHNFGRHSHIRSQLLEPTSSRTRQEVHNLMSFKASISADPFKRLSGWSANATTPCNWMGISCSSDGRRVVAVDLHDYQLAGDIGSALRALSHLQSLEHINLSTNFFTGSLPGSGLGNWSGLSYLNISMNHKTGALPPQLGELINLQTLDLQLNKLTGEIPMSICNCTALKSLDLGTNMLGGYIPEGIGRLSSLELLNLGSYVPDLFSGRYDATGNSFSGIVPHSLANCTALKILLLQNSQDLEGEILLNLNELIHLQVLNLSLCNFWGYIPAWIGNLTTLRTVSLRYNQFSGHIPSSIGNLQELSYLSLSYNNISGVIPPSILNCTSLTHLRLENNVMLTGLIPPDLGQLSKLRLFTLSSTSVTGVIPASLSNCSAMEYIGVTFNKLMYRQPFPAWLASMANLSIIFLDNINMHGPIPKEIGRLRKLQQLSVYNNFLTGLVPSELGNCTSLWLVQIRGNLFTGNLPPEIGNIPELRRLWIGYNPMTGPLPASLSNLTKIEMVDVSRSNFQGTIDSYWGSLPQLNTLLFSFSQFTGSVPATLGNLTTLQLVDFSRNRLTGEISPSLGNLTFLSYLALAKNQIRGTIPQELATDTELVFLDLGYNELEGNVPADIGGLYWLQKLYLGGNKLSGIVPESLANCSRMLSLDLAHNQFNGRIPAEVISRMDLLTFLNLSNNQFSGRWPLEIGNLEYIREINISGNSLSGPFIPGLKFEANSNNDTLLSRNSGWKLLEKLDISVNNFTDVIPESLGSLIDLRFFNASYNNFQGPIPDAGVFLKLTVASFVENPLLCGFVLGRDRECHAPSTGSSKSCNGFRCKHTWIPTICSAIILLASFYVLAIWFLARARRGKRFKGTKKLQDFKLTFDPVIKFSVDDVLQIIHQNHTLAKGPSSIVYKGIFPEDKTFVVKVLAESLRQVADGGLEIWTSRQSDVVQEVRIMANLRHRNILRVVGYCSHQEIKALILEYMPEGSLGQHLHGLGEGNCGLSWERRLNIALGAAEGMKYLHHDFPEPLIHGDLKPSNILLDSTFLPKIADFGLSKFVSRLREGQATASAICGTVGYIPPEYALGPVVSTKGDVYSYGIVLLELLSGRSPTSESSAHFDPSVDYRSWAIANYQNPVSLVDSALRDESVTDNRVIEQMRLTLLVALLCTKEMPQNRPTMDDVLRMLIDINGINLNPVERRPIQELAQEPSDRMYSFLDSWSVEDPNGAASPSMSSGHLIETRTNETRQ